MEQRIAHSYDLDDTLFDRGSLTRLLSYQWGMLNPHEATQLSRASLPQFMHQTDSTTPMAPLEHVALAIHAHRPLFTGAHGRLSNDVGDQITLYANTGRSNKKAWVAMTQAALRNAGIAHFFADVYHRPVGVNGITSKAVGIARLQRMYDRVIHTDDDIRTIVTLAPLFPEVTFEFIQHSPYGTLYMRNELESHQNIQRITPFASANQ